MFHFGISHWIASVIEDSYCWSVLPLSLQRHELQKKHAIKVLDSKTIWHRRQLSAMILSENVLISSYLIVILWKYRIVS